MTSSSSTLIDLIFTNCPEKVVCSEVSHVGISDYSLVFVQHKLGVERSVSSHGTITYGKFVIVAQHWDDLQLFDDPNDVWLAGKALFLTVVDKHAPLWTMCVCP